MPLWSRSPGVLLVVVIAGCAARGTPSAAAQEPQEPQEPRPAPAAVASEPVMLRYAARPGRFRQHTEIQHVVTPVSGEDDERSLRFEADLELGRTSTGASVDWQAVKVLESTFELPPDDPVVGLHGALALDALGHRTDTPEQRGQAAWNLMELGLLWPTLPADALVPDQTHTVEATHAVTLEDVEVPVRTRVSYTLTDVRPQEGRATLRIEGWAHGEAERDGRPLVVEQTTETTVVLSLAQGAPRRWRSRIEQRYDLDGQALTVAQSVTSALVPE